jgi:hypothetical protein
MKITGRWLGLFTILAVAFHSFSSEQISPLNPVIDLGQRLELFVDHHLIDSLQGVRLILHSPRNEGAALAFDRPWEGAFSGYVTVLKDGSARDFSL